MAKTDTKDAPTKPAPSTEVVIPDDTGEMVPMTRELVAAWLKGTDLTVEDEGDNIDLDEALRILGAADAKEVLSVNEMRKIDDYDGKAFVILNVAWRKSTRREDGEGRYAVMRCVDADGVEFLTTCGATKVVLQLRWAQLNGAFPWQVQLQVTKTEANRTVKELTAPEEPF